MLKWYKGSETVCPNTKITDGEGCKEKQMHRKGHHGK
jgi:hypothetical protein